MKKISWSLFLTLLVLILVAFPVFAQTNEYRLNIHRTFGFSSGSLISGTFTLDVTGPGSYQSVTYLIDGKSMGVVTNTPFILSFQTRQYDYGWHELSAEVTLTDGQKFTTPVRKFEFATADQETSGVFTTVIPILGLILLIMAGGAGIQILVLRKRPLKNLPAGAPRNYGPVGGCVCPSCHRTFGMHWWGPNMGFRSKFDRCDFCGHWNIVHRLSKADLAAAEAAEVATAGSTLSNPAKSEEERLKEMLDDSRFSG